MAVLETSVTSETRETMAKPQKTDKNQMKKVLVVAQELKLARVLAGNNKTSRDRALKSLKKWFQNRGSLTPFLEDDFLRLWKGLFYSMWMSDKPLIQEECAENISSLVHDLPHDPAFLFYKCGITTLMNEWFGIDQLRLDKFLMFVRRLLRQALFILKACNWSKDSIKQLNSCHSDTILKPKAQKPTGLLLHFIEIFLEELSKVADGELSPHLMVEFLGPFIRELAFSDDPRIIDHIKKHIFVHLIRQSDLGLEYDEKYKAWRSLGFPGSINSMKKFELEDSDGGEDLPESVKGEKVFDPRAGKVDVELAQLKFFPKSIVKVLSGIKFDKNTNSKSRKCITELIEHFRKMTAGIYPLGVKKIKMDKTDGYDTSIRKAVNRLVKFDQKITGKRKKKNKIQNDHEIELRGGKKIKLDDGLTGKIQDEFDKVVKKKRKIENFEENIPRKQRKINEPVLEIEYIFRRNSGTWLVTKTKNSESSVKTAYEKELSPVEESSFQEQIFYPKNTWVTLDEQNLKEETEISRPKPLKAQILFPNNRWDTSNDEITLTIEDSFKKNRVSLPTNLLNNPFSNSTPMKKVKINTKLNRSQDVQEHHAQIFSSPDIPYDPHKKPAKPLLKTPTLKSPINPFYLK